MRPFDLEIVTALRRDLSCNGEFARHHKPRYAIVKKYLCYSRVEAFKANALMFGVILNVGELCRPVQRDIDGKAVTFSRRNVEYENLWLHVGSAVHILDMTEKPTRKCHGVVARVHYHEVVAVAPPCD